MNASTYVSEVKIMGVRILILLALSSTANASDTLECLSKIAYAESRGTAVDGVVAVMHAALRHSKMIKRHVCLIPAQQKSLPLNLREVYSVLAKGVLGGSIPDLSNGADSWNNQLPKRGKITRRIGGNYFSITMSK